MRIAVTGLHGQVVTALLERGPLRGHEIVALGRPELDLAQPETVAQALIAAKPAAIVSAAAYTAVDKAESDADAALVINGTAPGTIAAAARELGVPLVHLSTDYVFDGSKASAYLESDPVAPLGVYGTSKLAGEMAVLTENGDNSAILRTAWVYSPFGANFVKTMLRLAADRDELGVVGDQFGNPTSALDIADGVLRVAENLLTEAAPELRGVFHMTAQGSTHWAGFAEAIFAESAALGGPGARVRAITTAEYPTPARRPANSRLECGKLAAAHGVSLPDWRESTRQVVARLVG